MYSVRIHWSNQLHDTTDFCAIETQQKALQIIHDVFAQPRHIFYATLIDECGYAHHYMRNCCGEAVEM